jgi:fatty-acyl-CoA synthase
VTSLLLPLVRGVSAVTLPPDDWMLDPGRILDVITSERSTLTWWPNFAFALLASKLHAEQLEAYDLSSLRMVVNASEPVLSRTYAEFRRRFADCGLRDSALQSAYGAPASVFAVTQSSGRAPKRAFLHRGRLECGATAEAVHDGHPEAREVLASGRPIDGARVRIVCGEHQPQADGYVGEIAVGATWLGSEDAWFYTGDAGVIHEGELFGLGPTCDTILASARRFLPADLERIAASVDGVSESKAVALGVLDEDRGTEEVVILVESAHFENRERAQSIKRDIRARTLAELDAPVDHVRVLPPGTLKPTRSENRALFEK